MRGVLTLTHWHNDIVWSEAAQIHVNETVLVDAIDTVVASSMHHIVIGAVILGHVYRCVRQTMPMVHLVHAHRVS